MNQNKRIVVYGTGPDSQVFFHELQTCGDLSIAAFCCPDADKRADTHCGLPLVSFEAVQALYPPEDFTLLPLAGHKHMRATPAIFKAVRAKGYQIPTYVSPGAVVQDGAALGEGSVICGQSFVGYQYTMGEGNLIRQQVYLGHQGVMGSYNIIAPGAVIGGKCGIGDLSFIGLNATVATYVQLGTECLIGAGSVVTKAIAPCAVAYGNPAREMRYHRETGVMF